MPTASQGAKAGGTIPPAAIRVWDPLVRVFHWSLLALVTIAFLTGDDWESLHKIAGYGIAGLVVFRLVWGLVGSRHARFADFVRSPAAIRRYLVDLLKGRAPRHLGHNPAGGAMIVALLALLSFQCGTGLMMISDAFWGAKWLEEVHEVSSNLLLGLIGLHVAGVLVSSLLHGENLMRAMWTGRKRAD